MADATQELMLRVRGDNSGADKAIAQTTRSLKGLSVSTEKASRVFKNLGQGLSESRDGFAAANTAALGLVALLTKSAVGTAIVAPFVGLSTRLIELSGDIEKAALASQKAFRDIENSGDAMSLAEAQSQVKGLEANISSLQIKLDELDKSPLQNFIAKASGARKSLEELQASQERLRDTELAAGMTSQNISEIKMAALDEEAKALEKINQEYRDRDKIAARMTNKPAQAQYQSESADKFARDRNALLDKQAKARAELQIKFANMVYDAEQKLADQAEARANKTQQERFDRINQNNNSIYKQEVYDIEEKSKMEMDAEDRKFQRELRNAYTLRAEQKKTQEDAKKAQGLSGGLLGASPGGQQALDSARKKREQENKRGDFKTQEAVFGKMTQEENAKRAARGESPITMQAMKQRVATEQAAREAPSLANQIQGGMTGVDPSQIASEQAKSTFQKQIDSSNIAVGLTQSRFEKQGKGIPAELAPATNKRGEETKSQSPELLTAIKALVDLMKSGTLVK